MDIRLSSRKEQKMKLYDLMQVCEDGTEITVTDKDYDMECYFYSGSGGDLWEDSLNRLAKLLDIIEIKYNFSVVTNISELIEKNIKALEKAKLFIDCDIDSIMYDMDNILAGNVSEKWLVKFVDALERKGD